MKAHHLFKKIILILLALIVISFLTIQIPDDPDMGIHLGVGRHILETHSFPHQDLFSFSLPTQDYVYYSWFGELVLTSVHDGWGFYNLLPVNNLWRLTIIWTLIGSLGIILLYTLSAPSFWLLTVFLVFSAQIFSSVGVRPQMFTFFFTVLETGLLIKYKKYRFLLIPLFLIWANTHLGFVMGLFVMMIYLLLEVVFNTPSSKKLHQLIKTIFLIICSFAATLINPYGFNLYLQAWKISQNPYNLAGNMEWVPLVARGTGHFLFAVITLSILIILSRQRKVNWPLYITTFILYVLMLRNTRTSLPFTVLFLPLISPYLMRFPSPVKLIKPASLEKLPFYIACAVLPLVIFYRGIINFSRIYFINSDPTILAIRNQFPYGAVQYIKNHPRNYRILNYFNWGGYLVWQIPNLKVFQTGIMDTFTVNNHLFFDDYFDMTNLHQNWHVLMQVYAINAVLLPPDTPLIQLLKTKSDWKIEYQDETSVFLMKITSGLAEKRRFITPG